MTRHVVATEKNLDTECSGIWRPVNESHCLDWLLWMHSRDLIAMYKYVPPVPDRNFHFSAARTERGLQ